MYTMKIKGSVLVKLPTLSAVVVVKKHVHGILNWSTEQQTRLLIAFLVINDQSTDAICTTNEEIKKEERKKEKTLKETLQWN